jgi:hypothetical protein
MVAYVLDPSGVTGLELLWAGVHVRENYAQTVGRYQDKSGTVDNLVSSSS